MPTQNNGVVSLSPPKEAAIQYHYHHHHNNNFPAQFHSTAPPTYEQSQYLPSSPSIDDLLAADPTYLLQEQENLNYHNIAARNNNNESDSHKTYSINKNNNIGPSSPPITYSLLNSPVPSAPPVELILDDESSSLTPPPPIANPNFHSNSFPNNSSSCPIINNSPYQQQHPQTVTLRYYTTQQQQQQQQQQQPIPTKSTELQNNLDGTMQAIYKFLKPLEDKRNWYALIYLLLWDMNFVFFSFTWILFTFCVSIPMFIIPPIGYTLLTWSVLSWRALAHVEFLAFNLVSTSFSSPLPPAHIPREPDQGYFNYLIQILTDGFTVRCFAYFVFIRPGVSLIAALCFLISIIIGVNLLILPIFMPMYIKIVDFESKLGRNILGAKNNDENGNKERVVVVEV